MKFSYAGYDWPLEPKTVFYDYIYYCAVRGCLTSGELEELRQYDAFTDIEFNPAKSINTQARSIAIVRLLLGAEGELPEMKPEEFIVRHKAIC